MLILLDGDWRPWPEYVTALLSRGCALCIAEADGEGASFHARDGAVGQVAALEQGTGPGRIARLSKAPSLPWVAWDCHGSAALMAYQGGATAVMPPDTTPSDLADVVVRSILAQLAVSCLARALRWGELPGTGPALSLMTLGQAIPMLSFLPAADALRADLHDISCHPRVTWLDVSAPGDGCSFALCDPVAVSGATPRSGKHGPLVLSAAFSRTLSPARWRHLKRRFFRTHFQYLCAFDRPGAYDYFRITAGPQTLAARFAGQRPSPSRIETPLSGYTSRAAAQ